MSFPRYPAYKDSGVEWFGALPVHWSLRRLKGLVDPDRPITYGIVQAGPDVIDGVPYVRPADMSDEQGVLVPELILKTTHEIAESYQRSRIRSGDLVVSIGPSFGKVMTVPQWLDGANLTQGTARVAVADAVSSYIFWVLRAPSSVAQWDSSVGGATFRALNLGPLAETLVPIPPTEEQTAIATFLDRETAKIDALVVEQERLIELLKEKRQAVISHAVTKGLDPSVPMKDSGVEWLGEVPAHWEIHRVKDYFQTCSGGTPNTAQQELYYSDAESGIPWVRTTDLRNEVLQAVEIFITEKALADTACTVLPSGTVMVAMYGGDGTVGKNGLLAIPAAINQAVCGLLPTTTHSPEFAFRFMQFYRPHWMIGAESSRKDPNISQERVRNAPFLRPPRHEQDAIVSFLDTQLQQFNTLTTEAQRAIDLLQERRTALISAAVTGQIDVRGLVTEKEAA